jgi:putative endonuclease
VKTKFYFYILRCKDKSLYCGMAKDLTARAKLHNSGKGSSYVRSRGGGKIVYSECFFSISKALRREAEVKKWPKAKKETLVRHGKTVVVK